MLDTVAPYVGAWIETLLIGVRMELIMSHPTWVRGLKLYRSRTILTILSVAPYVGAWIETSTGEKPTCLIPSHPTWVRGLKHETRS